MIQILIAGDTHLNQNLIFRMSSSPQVSNFMEEFYTLMALFQERIRYTGDRGRPISHLACSLLRQEIEITLGAQLCPWLFGRCHMVITLYYRFPVKT